VVHTCYSTSMRSGRKPPGPMESFSCLTG
jgi:hypothetical protein